MKLYNASGSCSLSAHIALCEANLGFELIAVDARAHTYGDGKDYYKINELGYVPALETDQGDIFREASVILQYIADLAPDTGLAPAHGTLERYRLQEWLNFLTSEIHKGFIPNRYRAGAEPYFDRAMDKLKQRFRWIDDQLAAKAYLMGSAFTIADCYLFAMTNWAKADWLVSVYNLDVDLTEFRNLEAWHGRVLQRPAVQQAMQAEGLIS